MITLKFFKDNRQIFALDCELEPKLSSTCIIKKKQFQVNMVRYVFDGNSNFIRLDVSEQKEQEGKEEQ
jgi:hypothetical protein